MAVKPAPTDHPIHDPLPKRWSPYAFSSKKVSRDDLRSLFEAARWSPSSYNEQPWRYIVAIRDGDEEHFNRVLSCLVENNQKWAKHAPVLGLGIISERFKRNDKENRAAEHDLGGASAHLTFEATARGIFVHQMIGIEPDKARETFNIPDGFHALTGIAIGYLGDGSELPEELRQRDDARRGREPIESFIFGERFGQSASWARK